MWFVTSVAGLSVRSDHLGVTSIVRALSLDAKYYDNLLDNCHSTGISLHRLKYLVDNAPSVLLALANVSNSVNGRPVIIADGKKKGKEGKKMPARKSLHQESESNTKPTFIMGHSYQALSVLVTAASTVFAVPLDIKIHEGFSFPPIADKRTLLDKLLGLLSSLQLAELCYLVADAYYSNGKMVKGYTQARSSSDHACQIQLCRP